MASIFWTILCAYCVSNKEEIRDKRVVIRVSPREKEMINFCCANSFMSVSDLGRKLFLDYCYEHNLRNFNRLVWFYD